MTIKAELKRLVKEHGYEAVSSIVSHADIVEVVHGLLEKHGWAAVAEEFSKIKRPKMEQTHIDPDDRMVDLEHRRGSLD